MYKFFKFNYLRARIVLPLLVFVLLLFSCGSDDECSASNWVGSWGGTITCLELDINFVFTITEQDDDTVVIDFGSEMQTVNISNCSVNVQLERTVSGNDFLMDLTLLRNEDLLDVSLTLMAFGNDETCSGTFGKR